VTETKVSKLIVPYVGELQEADARLLRLGQFLGAHCETLSLPVDVRMHADYLASVTPNGGSCLVVNPGVIQQWVRSERIPEDLTSLILQRFQFVFVHNLRADDFNSRAVAALSQGRFKSVDLIEGESNYEIAPDSREICGSFAGISFGPVKPANDHVLSDETVNSAARTLISIGDRPFMTIVDINGCQVIFLASEETADLNTEIAAAPLADSFSRYVPHAMVIRYIAGDQCWRPSKGHAAIVIDDPLLRNNYGFLNFQTLLRMTKEHNFHATIAFIPHNFRRNSRQTTRLFLENPARLSVCFHGNDHTESEFACRETTVLSTLLQNAEQRMKVHEQRTGLRCDKVMVFPQGNFSIEAMKALRSRNFKAAVNTVPYPIGEEDRLTIHDLTQPAVLCYGGFPLFLRKPSRKIKKQDIAFNVFFGRPVLVVEHHEIFQNPESLLEVVANINSLVPDVCWTNLSTIVSRSFLTRRESDGTFHVRPYAESVHVSNDSGSSRNYLIEWPDCFEGASVASILEDETRGMEGNANQLNLRVAAAMAPYCSRTFSLVHRDTFVASKSLGYQRHARAFVRRRLSEIRDNYLSKNKRLLRFAKSMQQRLLHSRDAL
jgi:hypothetical protein